MITAAFARRASMNRATVSDQSSVVWMRSVRWVVRAPWRAMLA
jgi:uncharacterized membrane protein YdfJ with MMPL/SSD domain